VERLDGDVRHRCLLRPEADAQCGGIGQPPRIEIAGNGIGKLCVAGPLSGQREKLDRYVAGMTIVIST
jgi:hypothetical protein